MAYQFIKKYCTDRNVELIVVSKFRPLEQINNIYEQGQRAFAENRVQDLLVKYEALPKDIKWHLIGTLQTNKVKYIAPFIHLIHSLDDGELWKEINKQAIKSSRIIPCLLQLKVAQEETKNGFEWNELCALLDSSVQNNFKNVKICGVMGMASLTTDENQIRSEFRLLKKYFDLLKATYFNNLEFNQLSMGMSSDYKIAIEEGSTMVRIGSAVFE